MTSLLRRGGSFLQAGVKFLKALLLILLFYLLQAAVVPHLKVAGVMPNLLMIVIAIMTVSLGKLYAFIAGAVVGILLEAMAMTIPLFYVIIYPVLALLCAQIFSDMSDVKREIRRIREAQRQSEAAAEISAPYQRRKLMFRLRRNSPYDLNPHLRILLNAITLVLLYEGVMLVYIALVGIQVGFGHIMRVLYAMIYTALCCVVMFPARAWLGLYHRQRRLKARLQEGEVRTERELLRGMAIVPDEEPRHPDRVLSILRRRAKKPVSVAEEEKSESERSGTEGSDKEQ